MIRLTTVSIFSLLVAIALFSASPIVAAQSVPANNIPSGTGVSLNWSGYAVTGSDFTQINGSWTLPELATSNTPTGDATWVGIGGITNTDLIQIGTEDLSTGGGVKYQAFYETLPQNSTIVPITVNGGDSITASLSEQSTGQWLLSIKDDTNGQSFQTNVSYNSSNSSAEWIEEMPSNLNNTLIPLDNFGTIQFTGGSVTQNGSSYTIAESQAQVMTMVNSNREALSTVSGLGSDGASFTVSRTSVAVSEPTSSSTRVYRTGSGVRGYVRTASSRGSYRIITSEQGFGAGGFNIFFRLANRF